MFGLTNLIELMEWYSSREVHDYVYAFALLFLGKVVDALVPPNSILDRG